MLSSKNSSFPASFPIPLALSFLRHEFSFRWPFCTFYINCIYLLIYLLTYLLYFATVLQRNMLSFRQLLSNIYQTVCLYSFASVLGTKSEQKIRPNQNRPINWLNAIRVHLWWCWLILRIIVFAAEAIAGIVVGSVVLLVLLQIILLKVGVYLCR